MKKIQPKIVYSPNYDIYFLGIEKLHSFDSRKYSRVWKELKKSFGDRLEDWRIDPGHPVSKDVLLTVHTPKYLKRLKCPLYLAVAFELPLLGIIPTPLLDSIILRPMRWATQGTILAAKEALEHGITVNLSGGYHHASRERGGGFCIYSDIAIAISVLRDEAQLKKDEDKILIIDLDAHQGNGLERIFYDDNNVYIFDMYNQEIYPRDAEARQRVNNCNVLLNSGTENEEYLSKLNKYLTLFLKDVGQPKIAFYNAGTDIYEGDPLGRLKVSKEGVLARDRVVFDTITKNNIPLVILLSGGYTEDSHRLVAESISYILRTYGRKCHD